jgi:hypothetical protein
VCVYRNAGAGTYWGHSGAPLFNEMGAVAGLHCAWDDRTGMRHGQKLQAVQQVLAAADAPVAGAGGGAAPKKKRKKHR